MSLLFCHAKVFIVILFTYLKQLQNTITCQNDPVGDNNKLFAYLFNLN